MSLQEGDKAFIPAGNSGCKPNFEWIGTCISIKANSFPKPFAISNIIESCLYVPVYLR